MAVGRLCRLLVLLVVAGLTSVAAACAPNRDDDAAVAATTASDAQPWARSLLQVNLAGGWAAGASTSGVDDVVRAVADRIAETTPAPEVVFLNEACESHAETLAALLGPTWRWFFAPAWPGESSCTPASGRADGRYGNAIVVADTEVRSTIIPSCNDADARDERCLPNWDPPAEQRRAVCITRVDGVACSVHLDPPEWQWHRAQLDRIAQVADALAAESGTVTIGGDFNAGHDAVRAAFARHAGTAFTFATGDDHPRTFPSHAPRRDVDHIVVVGRAVGRGDDGTATGRAIDLGRCQATHRPDGRCSDHHGLLALQRTHRPAAVARG